MPVNDASRSRWTRDPSSIRRFKHMAVGMAVARAVCGVAWIVGAGLADPGTAHAADLARKFHE